MVQTHTSFNADYFEKKSINQFHTLTYLFSAQNSKAHAGYSQRALRKKLMYLSPYKSDDIMYSP